ncbi:hypothetical protein PVL30_001851 [Lodderomyces elongisporus]|uniref:Prokaryotic-type class I peptide chain release factors domain-containing protein n=1 Tax=Lodderomyces elongisporus (strain ATCC 11503 / CBS 2605 / JCM 1781 / NBRC 1676 / NRRL YB-4239) TaxID=379508 RepID=A5DWZ3_LODEL|nr:uncharacterized protein PVL30_001851 [Lodderomyces elongisporus]EDK43701.1 conserved hypothetical protein [Lodderomyces elongisporus NRRL YB-4239]WLF78124.1 hypothetical protein PVL30_001851 [Lodderomyces elongisporus]
MLRQYFRCISSSTRALSIPKKNQLPPRPKWLINEDELEEKFLHGGSGPGGQKINKTNSKVQLTHKPTGIVVSCQESRSQDQNRKKAREILALKLEDIQNPQGSRNTILKERAQTVKANRMKKANRKYRALDEERSKQKAKALEEENKMLEELGVQDIDDEFAFIKNTKVDLK